MKYDYGARPYNSYHVTAVVTAKSDDGDHYTIEGLLMGDCHLSSGVEQYMALEYASSRESWKTIQAPCPTEGGVRFRESGILSNSGDGKVHLRAGAWGGTIAGSWGWGDTTIVVV
ncbi:hypothetical protein [Streptomyces sp. GS7]|uniref:hypothetical protein n=1 Tax=Streptomyces sp. GS7 TaxID=2692234 RepID=UPI001316B561|nr:hypothetical protein [Streptomyces sp. GS7]QHC21409.1 hypothetical protein GR130_08180 [Streptomyces sp. GS7]